MIAREVIRPPATPISRTVRMKPIQKVATLAVAVLLIATAYGVFQTRRPADNLPTSVSLASGGTSSGPAVDQSTLWTARWLAQMPTTAEERQTAEDALHIADKMVRVDSC